MADAHIRAVAVVAALREARDPLTLAEVRERVEDRLAETVSGTTIWRLVRSLESAAPRLGFLFERHPPTLAPSRAPRFRIRCIG